MYSVLIYHDRFLLPTLHVKMILEMPTKSQRRQALVKLPADLYKSFQGIITRIQGRPIASAELGMRVLMWLHFAYRPLQLVELQHALAVNKGHMEFDPDNIPSQKALLDCCLGLVIVDEETLTVRFVHFTLEEYFRKNFRTEFPNGYSSIAETCLTYLTFGNLRQHCTTSKRLKEMMASYPFLKYAALYWGTYANQLEQHTHSITELIKMLVEHDSERPPCAIQALYFEIGEVKRPSISWSQPKTFARRFSGIHALAYFGLGGYVVNFCEVELKDDSGRTPLSWAAGTGHEAVVRLLVERGGVDINSRDSSYGRTPLIWAAYKGHGAVVRLLVEREGVEINAKDDEGNTALILAAEYGHEAVVRLLIQREDVEINAKGFWSRTALISAVYKRHTAVLQLLIERADLEINAEDGEGRTAFTLAAEHGCEAAVRLLVERGDVEINANGLWGRTALIWAAYKGHEAVVRLLVERGSVEVNAKANSGNTALLWAACKGHEAVVHLLIQRDDIEINAKDYRGKTALKLATKCGHKATVQLLKDRLDMLTRGSKIAPGSAPAGGGAGIECKGAGGATTL